MSENRNNENLVTLLVNQTRGYLDISSKRELWQDISSEFNGKFSIGHNSGNELELLKITIPYQNLEIKLTESDTKPLKVGISFKSRTNYELIIGYEDFFEKLLKLLGKRDVEIGYEQFDEKYLVQSNDREITKKILTQEVLSSFIKYEVYSLAYTTDSKNQTAELISVISRTIDEKSAMVDLIQLHMRICDYLKELNIVE